MSEPTSDVTHLRPLSCLWARERVWGCSCRRQMSFRPRHLLPFSFSSGQDISITWQGPTQEVKNIFVFFLNANFDTRQSQGQRAPAAPDFRLSWVWRYRFPPRSACTCVCCDSHCLLLQGGAQKGLCYLKFLDYSSVKQGVNVTRPYEKKEMLN